MKAWNYLKALWFAILATPATAKRVEKLERDLENLTGDVRRLQELVLCGADIHASRQGSWAVVCMRDRGEGGYVKFFDLSGVDAREIRNILRSFSRERCITDFPPQFLPRDFCHGWK